jgi:ClpP class serine protease
VFFDPKAVDPYGIASMLVEGPLEHRASWWASYDAIEEQVEAALACPQVTAVALKIDSPGGVAAGMGQCHRRLIKLQKQYSKLITAYVDELACSAAYNLAAACRGGIWLAREATVGSIGVILCTVDESARLERDGVAVRYVVTGRRKADLHPGSPVTDEVLSVAQAKVDELGGHFFRAMARARSTSPEAIEELEAAVFSGASAVRVGLADGVADWDSFLGTLRAGFGASVDISGGGAAGALSPSTSAAALPRMSADDLGALYGAMGYAYDAATGEALPAAGSQTVQCTRSLPSPLYCICEPQVAQLWSLS